MGMLYVLDEPSIGLHPKDNAKMIETLRNYAISATLLSSLNTMKAQFAPQITSLNSDRDPVSTVGMSSFRVNLKRYLAAPNL